MLHDIAGIGVIGVARPVVLSPVGVAINVVTSTT